MISMISMTLRSKPFLRLLSILQQPSRSPFKHRQSRRLRSALRLCLQKRSQFLLPPTLASSLLPLLSISRSLPLPAFLVRLLSKWSWKRMSLLPRPLRKFTRSLRKSRFALGALLTGGGGGKLFRLLPCDVHVQRVCDDPTNVWTVLDSLFLASALFTCYGQIAGAIMDFLIRAPSIVLMLHLRLTPYVLTSNDAIPPSPWIVHCITPRDTTADECRHRRHDLLRLYPGLRIDD